MFRPILISSCPGTATFPSVEAIVIDFPLFDSPNSLSRSTRMVRVFPSIVMSTFFIWFSVSALQADMRFDAARAGVVPVTNAKIAALLLPWLRFRVRIFPGHRAVAALGVLGTPPLLGKSGRLLPKTTNAIPASGQQY